MRIMLLVSSMHAGGAERVAATLVNAWAARGDTAILVPTYSSKGTCFYPLSDDVQLHWLADRAGTRAGGPLAAVRRLAALRAMVREMKPDVVVSFLTNVNIAAILATRGQEAPVIVCERTNPVVAAAAGRGLSALRRLLYPRADMVTVQAAATVEPFARMVPGIRRLAVIANPLPSDLADAPLVPVDQAAGRKRLAGMGRMVPEKQFDHLIAAFAGLAPSHPDWDLWLWGDGPQREALEAQVAQAGLQGRVFMPGRTETPWEEMRMAHAFVMSSSVEGFPNVLLEAMSLGMPCVTYDCPSGPREITREGQDALLVPLGDRAGLRNAIQALMDDPARRVELGARAAQSVRGRYSLPAVLADWDRLFADVRGQG
ncbi:glycosyltransferase [Bordetella ansorpii]|uniref:Glycosyltransferase n=1 Tax=Bordetella ansorpii TaxID=288768 RepID=A0A157SHH5_9BORD|nr:glycosyltransferase family 4 protein [Bordetella ansorpii]SAI69774.1 glycosyltransferase [Bordetella ansorpii]